MDEETIPGAETAAAIARHSEHYERTMGAIPDSLRVLAEIAPEAFDGYSTLRDSLLGHDEPGRLPLKYRHLICSTLDCANHNLSGAENHVRAAIRAGLETRETADAMLMLIITCGTPAWGQYGRHVLATARNYAAELERQQAKR